MLHVIITFRSLSWIICSMLATILIAAAILNSSWIAGPDKIVEINGTEVAFSPGVGIAIKCVLSAHIEENSTLISGEDMEDPFYVYPIPIVFKIAWCCMLFGFLIMCTTSLYSLSSICYQACMGKSKFEVTGVCQSGAIVFLVLGIMIYPMGWGTEPILKLCGPTAAPYYLGNCHFGLGTVLAVLGVLVTVFSCYLSKLAEKSTSSADIEEKISEGSNIVCAC